jgi:prevent-host-death family protein
MVAHSSRWQLQEAKNRLSEVIRRAKEEGPQTITVRGQDAVVVLSARSYAAYGAMPRPRETLYEFMQRWSERMEGIELELPERRAEPMREGVFEALLGS